MARDVNGKVVKVGDKVKTLTNGGYGRAYTVGKDYKVEEISNGGLSRLRSNCGTEVLGFAPAEIELVEEGKAVEELQPVVESNLTPKLIESLDDLKTGDYFSNKFDEVQTVTGIELGDEYPVKTLEEPFNLEELLKMGAYKVKVAPLEMVEVEEVKHKLYELVEGESYVKLDIGDIVKFLTGLELKVAEVDKGDTKHTYRFEKGGNHISWIYTGFLVPENIISINGVNIHEEEEVAVDPYAGWVEGAKVKYVGRATSQYDYGQEYLLGHCASEGNFGAIGLDGFVYGLGHIRDGGQETFYSDGGAYQNFELIKE